jgi:hypothetical protein
MAKSYNLVVLKREENETVRVFFEYRLLSFQLFDSLGSWDFRDFSTSNSEVRMGSTVEGMFSLFSMLKSSFLMGLSFIFRFSRLEAAYTRMSVFPLSFVAVAKSTCFEGVI